MSVDRTTIESCKWVVDAQYCFLAHPAIGDTRSIGSKLTVYLSLAVSTTQPRVNACQDRSGAIYASTRGHARSASVCFGGETHNVRTPPASSWRSSFSLAFSFGDRSFIGVIAKSRRKAASVGSRKRVVGMRIRACIIFMVPLLISTIAILTRIRPI